MDAGWNARTRSKKKKFSCSFEDQRIHVRRSGRIPDARERMVEKSLGVRSSARVEGGIEVEVGGSSPSHSLTEGEPDLATHSQAERILPRKGSFLPQFFELHDFEILYCFPKSL